MVGKENLAKSLVDVIGVGCPGILDVNHCVPLGNYTFGNACKAVQGIVGS